MSLFARHVPQACLSMMCFRCCMYYDTDARSCFAHRVFNNGKHLQKFTCKNVRPSANRNWRASESELWLAGWHRGHGMYTCVCVCVCVTWRAWLARLSHCSWQEKNDGKLSHAMYLQKNGSRQVPSTVTYAGCSVQYFFLSRLFGVRF